MSLLFFGRGKLVLDAALACTSLIFLKRQWFIVCTSSRKVILHICSLRKLNATALLTSQLITALHHLCSSIDIYCRARYSIPTDLYRVKAQNKL